MRTRREIIVMEWAAAIGGPGVRRACAKRLALKKVEPLEVNGVAYTARHRKDAETFVAAVVATPPKDAAAWSAELYRIAIDPDLERDAQERYITKLSVLPDGRIRIDTESRRVFTLDPATRRVTERKRR